MAMTCARLVMASSLMIGTVAHAEVAAPPPAASQMAPAQAAKVLALFERLLDTLLANKDDCAKMAGAVDKFVDANKPLLRQVKADQAAGRALPPAEEAKLTERMGKEMASLQKCIADPAVQGAMKRLADPDLPPAPPASVLAAVKPPVAADLATYTKSIGGTGDLIATIKTTQGTIRCKLLAEQAPMTVANFVGLATGKKPWLDPRTNKVQKNKPYYDGLAFHRVIPDFMIQGGDPLGTGTGGPGYEFGDESSGVKMQPGVLAMANAGPGTNGGQFFITEGTPSYLDGRHTIFGQCTPLDVVKKITGVKRNESDVPDKKVTMKIKISRGKL